MSVGEPPLNASQVAEFVGADLYGPDIEVTSARPVEDAVPGCVCFAYGYTAAELERLNLGGALLITERRLLVDELSHIAVENPRLVFARVLERYFARDVEPVSIRAAIHDSVVMGNKCRVKAGAVIGGDGFGFERDEHNVPVRIPHIGGVVMGDNVEVGANTVIARGTVADTVIGDHVKLDDHVFVAHNVRIGARTLVVAGAVLCGSSKIGEDCWIGASACVKEHVKIGDGAMVGMGAMVLKDVEPKSVVIGNPSRFLRWRDE
jgi:UDP-3-O-[3-hydroxymyristoyl] glucosamine N-acyltransferase